jgi:hypothetical protein
MNRGQIRRLASALGSHESDVIEALQRGTVDHLVEGASTTTTVPSRSAWATLP